MQLNGATVLVTGSKGMLAADLLPLLVASGAKLILTDLVAGQWKDLPIGALDITNREQVLSYAKEKCPQVIINCAAYTAVDKAETDLELAFSANAIGPENLALAAQTLRGLLVHISTDYVFGGDKYATRKDKPYCEDEIPSPCGIYGHSKRMGEELIRAIAPESSIIVRTSWLHGVHGPNFIATIAKLAKEREELSVVNDQFGSPTWAKWLAEVLIALIEKDARGTFHASSHGDISWFEFAQEIVKLTQGTARVLPQTTAELNRPARRPAYSTFDLSKLENTLGKACISWREGLQGHLNAMKELAK